MPPCALQRSDPSARYASDRRRTRRRALHPGHCLGGIVQECREFDLPDTSGSPVSRRRNRASPAPRPRSGSSDFGSEPRSRRTRRSRPEGYTAARGRYTSMRCRGPPRSAGPPCGRTSPMPLAHWPGKYCRRCTPADERGEPSSAIASTKSRSQHRQAPRRPVIGVYYVVGGEPDARIVRIALEPGAGAPEPEAVAPLVHVSAEPLTADPGKMDPPAGSADNRLRLFRIVTAGIAIEAGAALRRHADDMAGLVQHRMHRRIEPGDTGGCPAAPPPSHPNRSRE